MNRTPQTARTDRKGPSPTPANRSDDGEDPLLSRAGLARWLGIGTRHVSNLEDEGLPVLRTGRKNLYRWSECREFYLNRVRSRAPKGPAEGEDAKTRKLEADARLAELELAKVERSLIPVADAERVTETLLHRLSGRLNNVPSKYAARCVGIGTVAEAIAVLDGMVQELRDELHRVEPEEAAV